MKNFEIKNSFLVSRGRRAQGNKTVINFIIRGKLSLIWFYKVDMIIQYGWEQYLIQQILIGFEAMLEIIFRFLQYQFSF